MRLAVARRGALLSQRDLAVMAGVSPSTIALLELGRTPPALRTIRKLCAVLGKRLKDIDEFARVLDLTVEGG